VNTPDTIAEGQVICEVGVAVAAPAEFIVFRLGRKEGVVQVVE
jgi:phage tail sheath protein FI